MNCSDYNRAYNILNVEWKFHKFTSVLVDSGENGYFLLMEAYKIQELESELASLEGELRLLEAKKAAIRNCLAAYGWTAALTPGRKYLKVIAIAKAAIELAEGRPVRTSVLVWHVQRTGISLGRNPVTYVGNILRSHSDFKINGRLGWTLQSARPAA